MENVNKEAQIFNILSQKSAVKQKVFDTTLTAFNHIKDICKELESFYNPQLIKVDRRVTLKYKDCGLYQSELKVAGDLLVYYMHSNVFEFDRDHGIWKISYVQNNNLASYCGVINIYNFLNDSFRYERMDDVGYLLGRIFINKDNHFFVEGKRKMGFFYNNFGEDIADREALKNVIQTAILYSLEFDLFVPPYETVQTLSVSQITEKRKKILGQTGKRLGYNLSKEDQEIKTPYTGK